MKITQPLVKLPRSKLVLPLKHRTVFFSIFPDETPALQLAADTKLFPCSTLFNLISDFPYNYFLCFCNFLLVFLIPFCVGADLMPCLWGIHYFRGDHWACLSPVFDFHNLPRLVFASLHILLRNNSSSALSSPITFVLIAKLNKLDSFIVTSEASLSAKHF